MRILFAGTPPFAVPSLERISRDHTVVGVLTAPDRRRRRGKGTEPSPVAMSADGLGIPIIKASSLRTPERARISDYSAELLVVVAFGRIFGPKFLSLFPHGGINLHPSLLPRHRGPAPIPSAILSGDEETGITVQRLALEMDAGAILDQVRVPLEGTETTESLTTRFAGLGAERLTRVIGLMDDGVVEEREQDTEAATFCGLIEKSDGLIDWSHSAAEIDRMVRAYTPWPTAYTTFGERQLSILEATPRSSERSDLSPGTVVGVDKSSGILIQTGTGTLAVKHLQLQSKKSLRFNDFLNGVPDFIGAHLGAAL